METNEVLDRLPAHLMDLVIDQPYNDYTPQDHAVWRYIMRQNIQFLPGVAHESYLSGLEKTGISVESIPRMYGMNRILEKIGWAAVAVDGFIPPSAFMEFQAYHVLVIAADMRPITQIGYTPAPDIVHEAAGHAPIIAHPEYAAYLVKFGEIGSKAFSSKKDFEVYEAIRLLSILKADPYAPASLIREAERTLAEVQSSISVRSELAMIRNLHWWTVEYGLIGDLRKPRIYGAGLLSSISESYNCLTDKVRKIPYSADAAFTDFDITTQQPQLFVTQNFGHLTTVLEEFAGSMALRSGGLGGVQKAIDSGSVSTCVYSSGVQVSGILGSCIEFDGQPAYIRFTSPASIAYRDAELPGQGREHHVHGFSSPVGNLLNEPTPLEELDEERLAALADSSGVTNMLFESGVHLTGKIIRVVRKEGKTILISFSGCMVTCQNDILFRPDWGTYDMAVGKSIDSVFSGPADPLKYGVKYPAIREQTHKIVHDEQALALHRLYQQVRDARAAGKTDGDLTKIWDLLKKDHPADWLLPLEILEVTPPGSYPDRHRELMDHLSRIRIKEEFTKLIDDGLNLITF